MLKNRLQKAGEKSTQIQARDITIVEGVTEEEIRKILSNEQEKALNDLEIAAHTIANERLNKYTEIFLPKLVKANLMECFSEPSFQLLFRKTEESAVSSDREINFQMLSELLIHRAKRKDDYVIKASVSKAVEIVDKISDEALLALTILFTIVTYYPVTGRIRQGLKVLDDLFGKILNNMELPSNNEWIDNLEILGTIRVSNLGRIKKFDNYLYERLGGYSVFGIKKDEEKFFEFSRKLQNNRISKNMLIDHEINKGYTRINIVNESSLEKSKFTEEQKKVLKEIYHFSKQNKLQTGIFTKLISGYKNLNKIMIWWNKNLGNVSINVNSVGKALAHANAKTIDSSLPDLN